MADEVKNTAQTSENVENVVVDEKPIEQATETTPIAEGESQSTPEAKEQKPVQSKEQNADYARARREREQSEALQKARKSAAEEERVKSVIEFVKTNPYTQKPITNAEEVKQYLRMKAISDKGGDPVNDYADEIDRELQEKTKAENERAEYQQKIVSDTNNFRKAHPEVDLNELLHDVCFQGMFALNEGKSLQEVYDKVYLPYIAKIEKSANIKAAQKVAQEQSGTGSAKQNSASPEITKQQFRKMSVDERSKLYVEDRALYESLTK